MGPGGTRSSRSQNFEDVGEITDSEITATNLIRNYKTM
jgi:hypothetical protein